MFYEKQFSIARADIISVLVEDEPRRRKSGPQRGSRAHYTKKDHSVEDYEMSRSARTRRADDKDKNRKAGVMQLFAAKFSSVREEVSFSNAERLTQKAIKRRRVGTGERGTREEKSHVACLLCLYRESSVMGAQRIYVLALAPMSLILSSLVFILSFTRVRSELFKWYTLNVLVVCILTGAAKTGVVIIDAVDHQFWERNM
ncbi:unnamed protein product [Toxocara canis]|uniref:Transmembrane protein n=1 Tax=Toxocara canis TaxID=6265 RepID=A0A183UCH1_TOXCA|nr:unnamed protein product [Toxocara canis]